MIDRDRQRGTLLGLAIGDALGASVEFAPPGSFPEVTDFRGGGPHGLEPGEWTDDTSLALALADSLAQAGWDLNDQMRRYVAWWREGKYSVNGRCFDIGTTTQNALIRFLNSGDARSSGDDAPRTSGNGSIVRLAPVAIQYADLFNVQLGKLIHLLAESSLPTHASSQCLSACTYLGLVLVGLIQGLPRDEVLAPDWEPLVRLKQIHPLHAEIAEVADGSFRRKQPPEIVSSGYVVRSLEAALWAFHDATDFSQAVLRAVNLGGNANTAGPVCGQLAGACWGESGIPARWRDGLARRDLIDYGLACVTAK